MADIRRGRVRAEQRRLLAQVRQRGQQLPVRLSGRLLADGRLEDVPGRGRVRIIGHQRQRRLGVSDHRPVREPARFVQVPLPQRLLPGRSPMSRCFFFFFNFLFRSIFHLLTALFGSPEKVAMNFYGEILEMLFFTARFTFQHFLNF